MCRRLRMNIFKRKNLRVIVNMFRGNFFARDFAEYALVAHRCFGTHRSDSLPGAVEAGASSSRTTKVRSPVALVNLFPNFCAAFSFGSLPTRTRNNRPVGPVVS